MDNSTIALKPVKELLGMSFHIPDYQRGYRWTAQQAKDLLSDIWEFAQKENDHTEEIYCVQPLVVQQKAYDIKEEILKKLEDDSAEFETHVKKIISGTWNVVDGQQRLTTIYLILTALGESVPYDIDYETRPGSKEFLSNIKNEDSGKKARTSIDYFHIYNVYQTAVEWLAKLNPDEKKKFWDRLLNKVNFIWYAIPGENTQDAIAAFKRLNIGKIPLTDAELVKALFLNRTNFDCSVVELETQQRKIATEWDQIEYALQDDVFWLFLHGKDYKKPTRIDFILDMICQQGMPVLKENPKGKQQKRRDEINAANKKIDDKIGNDEHQTFRYFYYIFTERKDMYSPVSEWAKIRDYFRIFNEWFCDYKLYHYIGYLTTVTENKNLVAELVSLWRNEKKQDRYQDGTKAKFIDIVKDMIHKTLCDNKGFPKLGTYKYDEEYEGGTVPKTKCVRILLLHNIETIIQQNEKLVENEHYGMPNFTRFPFHLYKAEKWEVEHIRPNAGDKLEKPAERKTFLKLALTYLPDRDDLHKNIQRYLLDLETEKDTQKENTTDDSFAQVLDAILKAGDALSEEDKNKIWNYALLDKKTNIQYGNAIFPVKRAFLANKERGYKTKIEGGKVNRSQRSEDVAFVLPCTKNVFAKFYTDEPNGLLSWTEQDARAYLEDMREKLEYYIIRSGGEKE